MNTIKMSPASRFAVCRAEAGDGNCRIFFRCDFLRDGAFTAPGQGLFRYQPDIWMREQVIDMPVDFSGLLRGKPSMAGNPFLDASSGTSYVSVKAGGKDGFFENPDIQL